MVSECVSDTGHNGRRQDVWGGVEEGGGGHETLRGLLRVTV